MDKGVFSTEIIVAFFSVLTLVMNLIFLLISKKRDDAKDSLMLKNKIGLELCSQWNYFYKLEESYIKEISRLREKCGEDKSSEKTIKETFRSEISKTGNNEKLLTPSEIADREKKFK